MAASKRRGGAAKPAQARRAAREARLAAALRDNLRRRKDQLRARAEGEPEPGADSRGPAENIESDG